IYSPPLPEGISLFGSLNLDDLCPEISQYPARKMPVYQLSQLKYQYTIQRFFHIHPRYHPMPFDRPFSCCFQTSKPVCNSKVTFYYANHTKYDGAFSPNLR